MDKYYCSDCDKKFESKVKYNIHKTRKTPCKKKLDSSDSSKVVKKEITKKMDKKIVDYSYLKNPTNNKIFELVHESKKEEDKIYILNKIKQAHNILYESENIQGEDALNDIMNIIFLRLIFDRISDKEDEGKIDIFNPKYYAFCKENYLQKIFKYFDLKELIRAPINELRSKKQNDAIRQMGYILKLHPLTGKIFTEENFLKIEKELTLRNLISTMIVNEKTRWDINKMYEIEDLIGEIYESFLNGYTKTNSKLGQFFTPRNLMSLVLLFLKNELEEIINQYKEYHIGDFCAGTGGWMVIYYNLFKTYDSIIKISIGEVKANTFQYALMNIITTTNKMPFYAQRDNSLTCVDKTKYHLILSNPPFKTSYSFKNIKTNFESDKYTKQNELKINDVYKLQSDNPPIQFLELCIYKLHDNGKCIIVLPYGELFFGSSHKKSREYFVNTIDITHIIIIPSGVFTHTGIKTCILIFNKNINGTHEITFLKSNRECTQLIEIIKINKKDIENEPNLSLYYQDYLNDEYITDLTTKILNAGWAEFGNVFALEKGKLQSSKVEEDKNGDVLFISKSDKHNVNKLINSEIFYDGGLFIANAFNGNGKCPIIYTNNKCIHSDLMSRCIVNEKYTNKLDLKFMYYYLRSIKKHIEENYQKGSCNLSLDIKNFNRMKIPIPNMEMQERIINYFDSLCNRINIMKELLVTNVNLFINFFEIKLKNLKVKFEFLEDVIEKIETGKSFGKDEIKICGNIPNYGSNGIMNFVDTYLFDGEYVLLGRTGSCGECHYVNGKFCAGDTVFIIKSNNEILKSKFLFYVLKLYKLNNVYQLEGKGSVIGVISKTNLLQLKIPCPLLDVQNEFINELNQIDNEYTLLKDRIKLNNDKLNNELIHLLKNEH